MAHLVPNPPPKNYQNISSAKFTVFSKDGVANVLVWGLPRGATDAEFQVATTATGINGAGTVQSKVMGWAYYSDLVKFEVRGLKSGESINVFRQTNFGAPAAEKREPNWVPHGMAMDVAIPADHSSRDLANGKLPTYKNNANIKFYPFGSQQMSPPVKEESWKKSVEAVLDQLWSNAFGQQIIKLIDRELVISPWVPNDPNAVSLGDDVRFSPQNWTSFSGPGSSPDEVLLHEFIHFLEGEGGNDYADAANFIFHKTDFMSINATNVYSCLLGRALRKDHKLLNSQTQYLPQEYFNDPNKHFNTFKSNYEKAKNTNAALFNTVKNASRLWNPFVFL